MKAFKSQFIVLCSCLVLSVARGQTFRDLNFERANPVVDPNSPYYPYAVTATSAFPGWTVTIGGVQQADVAENDPSLGSTWVSLCGPNPQYGPAPLDGNYSVLLQGGETASTAAISQTGLIPATAEVLMIDGAGAGSFNVYIGNQNLALMAVGSGPNYTVYEASVSAWAGQTEPLTVSVPEFSEGWEIDDIAFSTVPEPSVYTLTVIAGIFLGARRLLMQRS